MTLIADLAPINFKAFNQFKVSFRSEAVLVGPNNAGKSTIIGALTAVAHMLRHARSRSASEEFSDRNTVVPGYSLEGDRFGLVTANLRHEFHPTETRIELTFKAGSRVTAVWPSVERVEDLGREFGFFYLEDARGACPRRPAEVRRAFSPIGVVPLLSPFENEEKLLREKYLREQIDNRLASRHFRNHLYLMQSEPSEFGRRSRFDDFVEFTRPWLPELDLGELTMRDSYLDLFYLETGSRREKEIKWVGDGMQIWLQILHHIFRLRGTRAIVLDEPDVYLHTDLQRRLIRLLESQGTQVITATHSPEMLAEARTESVVWVDKTRTSGILAPGEPVLSELSNALGSDFNIRLARAMRTKLALFVEGTDMKILRNLARTLNCPRVVSEARIAILPLGGYSNWPNVEGFKWVTNNLLEGSVTAFMILDRDYRSDAEIHRVLLSLKGSGIEVHFWERKELESYLLQPTGIARLSGASVEETATMLDQAADRVRERVFARMLHAKQTQEIAPDRHAVYITEEFVSEFDELWTDPDFRLWRSPPKQLLPELNKSLRSKGYSPVGFRRLSVELTSEEIPDEVAKVIKRIELLAG